MDRGTWWATSSWGHKESDTTEQLSMYVQDKYIYIYLGSISIDWDKLLINSFKTYTEHLPWVIHQESCNG